MTDGWMDVSDLFTFVKTEEILITLEISGATANLILQAVFSAIVLLSLFD